LGLDREAASAAAAGLRVGIGDLERRATEIFDKMEPAALERVYKRLYEELSKPENHAALEILRETKRNLPAYYN